MFADFAERAVIDLTNDGMGYDGMVPHPISPRTFTHPHPTLTHYPVSYMRLSPRHSRLQSPIALVYLSIRSTVAAGNALLSKSVACPTAASSSDTSFHLVIQIATDSHGRGHNYTC